MEARIAPAVAALAEECSREIGAEGGIPTRNPEELLEVFTLLTWAEQALTEAGRLPPPPIVAALERMAPTLRALRHADGGLARFHGGGRGVEGRLDQALAVAGVKPGPALGQVLAMGFARMIGGRTTVLVDAAPPPDGRAGLLARFPLYPSKCVSETAADPPPHHVRSCFQGSARRAGLAGTVQGRGWHAL